MGCSPTTPAGTGPRTTRRGTSSRPRPSAWASCAFRRLIVTGGRDLAYNETIGETLRESIPGATALRLPRAGHMANMEDPDAVNAAIAALAERVTDGA